MNSQDNLESSHRDIESKSKFYAEKKYWLLLIILFLIIVVILIPVLILVVFPKTIQNKINKSTITITSLSISPPITESSFRLLTKSKITNAGSLDASIKFPDPVNIIWNGTVLGNVRFPETKIDHGEAEIESNEEFLITNGEKFKEFTKAQLNDKEFTWTLDGKATVKALSITKSGLDFKKDILLAGGNGLRNVNITSYIVNATSPTTLDQSIKADLYNPSSITFYLGSFGIDIYYNTTYIGPAESRNLTINPGQNTILFSGPLASNFSMFTPDGKLGEIGMKYVMKQEIVTTSKGAYVKPDGVNEVGWLSDAVKTVSFVTSVKNASILPLDAYLKKMSSAAPNV
ncbi:hypothetical protein G9A89_002651 [Geosiphon pyriformis]|nr:hypothetical protein G9A89_002651 [Geosiphon pyriformis]